MKWKIPIAAQSALRRTIIPSAPTVTTFSVKNAWLKQCWLMQNVRCAVAILLSNKRSDNSINNWWRSYHLTNCKRDKMTSNVLNEWCNRLFLSRWATHLSKLLPNSRVLPRLRKNTTGNYSSSSRETSNSNMSSSTSTWASRMPSLSE